MNQAGERIGWIGCGRMGAALAARLLRAGADVAVYNRTRSKAEALVPLGATVVDAVADLADRDVVYVSVAGPDDFRAVTIGPDGVLAGDGPVPAIVVDLSTVSAEVSEEVREAALARGTQLLAAPVSGNAKVVEAGSATFAVSGPREVFERVRPQLELLGRGSHYVGDGEHARLVKIAHNLILGTIIQSLVETLVLVEKSGVSRSDYLAFVNDSVVGSVFSRYKTPALVHLDWKPTFTLPLLRKDLGLGLAAAEQVGSALPLAAETHRLVQEAIDAGHLEEDFAILLEVQAVAAGLAIAPEEAEVGDGLALVEAG